MREVATRFSSAKPAPEGAWVRSPSTHQLPSGPRPISKAMKCRWWPPRGPHADQRPQPLAAAGDQARRQVAVGDQAVRAVEVGDQRLEQVGALHEAAGDAGGLGLLDQHRDVGERPGALAGAGGAVLAEEDAGVAQVLVAAGETVVEVVGRQAGEVLDERPPDRADAAGGVEKLVGDPGRRAVVREQARDRVVGRWLAGVLLSQPDSLRGGFCGSRS